ncbi:MAG TPA: hypothetical protein VLT79_03525 [Gemmatimonadales bacterium]|nr:hypothetical protein [Gemmatimonadales bacterium]
MIALPACACWTQADAHAGTTSGWQAASWPNQPPGYTVITDYGFGDSIPAGNGRPVGSSGWQINNGYAVLAQDPKAPFSPPNVLRLSYPIGLTGGVAPATVYFHWAGSSDVYYGFWWRPSNPWQGHSSGVNKIVEFFDNNTRFGSYFYKMVGSGPPFHTQVTFETDRPTINFAENEDRSPVRLGAWHLCEFLLTRSDSTVRWWLDGRLKGRYRHVHYGGTKFTEAQVYPGWGGTGDRKREQDYYWFDHIHVAARP